MVSETLLSAVSITDTVVSRPFATYTFVPFVLTATPRGFIPTVMVAETLLVAVSIRDTVELEVLLAF